jgi:zinc protease
VPTAVQGELNVGNLVSNPMNNKDYHALLVANQILGGGAESKLFMNLREKHGFTYGSYSRIGSGRFQSLFTASAAVRSDKVDSATAEIFSEILNMRDGKITQEELDIAKAKYNGSFALGMEDPSRTATYASNILINNLPKDFYKTFLQKINSVSLNDLKRVSGIYFNENHSRIVIAGNGSVILPKLMRLGYPVKKFDRYANPVIDKAADVKGIETAKNTNSISASEIIETYLKAIGGKDEVKKVTSMSSVIGLDMMGRSFEGVEKKMNPGMQMLELKMGTMTVMKMVFNGTSGFQQQGPQKKDLSEKEIKEAQDDKGVIPQLYYITDGAYKTDYLGTGKVDDEDTYRLKVVMPSGRTSIQEYSVKTGLLLKEETTSIQEGADIPMTIEYKNYKKTGALLLPTEITRNAGGQEIPFKYKEIKLNEGVTDADFK